MRKSKIFERLLSIDRNEIIERRRVELEKLTLSYQLGLIIGDEISGDIPTLSCDGIFSKKVIRVTDEEESEVRRLEGLWGDSYQINRKTLESELLFKQYRNYVHILQDKYFEKTIVLRTRILNVPVSEMDEFKRGISVSLWNCDFCSYSTDVENIKVEQDESLVFTEISLVYLGD